MKNLITQIRLANTEDMNGIIELLNKVTLNLKEKGINQWEYPWKAEEIIPCISKGNLYVMISNKSIIGTFSIKKIKEKIVDIMEIGDAYIYRIAILPELQGEKLGKKIIDYACEYVTKQSRCLYLDCWSGNDNLKKFYNGVGLDYLGDFPENDYFISVFRYKPVE